MRRLSVFGVLSVTFTGVVIACSSSNGGSGFGTGDDGGASKGTSSGSGTSSGTPLGDGGQPISFGEDGSITQPGVDGGEVITTTIYAQTDTELYSMDPDTKAVTDIGPFVGVLDAAADYEDQAVTDLAVDAEGDIYVNTEAFLYKATLPATGTGNVQLTEVARIQQQGGAKFVALAFAPTGVLGTGETLVGGDESGELWSIDKTTGATEDLGSFGEDPNHPGNILALSGDIMFYANATGAPLGLATIRSCVAHDAGSPTCVKNDDFLAAIDMTALTTAYTSNQRATTLNGGIYGATDGGAGTGAGVGYGELFGLGAWEGNVYGFGNYQSGKDGGAATAPSLVTIDPATGLGTVVTNNFSFQNGWAGAGVTTKVTVTIISPPPPPTPQ